MISTAFAMGGNQGAKAPQGAGGFGDWSFIVMMVVIFVIFYFLMIRPQQKKQKEVKAMMDNLAYGDTVMTSGGIHGKVTGLADAVVTLEIADKVRIKIARSAIAAVIQKAGASATSPATKS